MPVTSVMMLQAQHDTVHEPPQGARLTLRSFTKTDDDGNAWKYASVSYGDGTEYSGYILEQALMYVAANPVYATSSEAKTVYKGPATTAAVMDTIDANEDVQVRGVVYRNNGTTWYGVHTGSTMGFIKSDNKVTLSDDLVYTRTHTEVVNDTMARKQFRHVRPQPAARAAIRCMRSLWLWLMAERHMSKNRSSC